MHLREEVWEVGCGAEWGGGDGGEEAAKISQRLGVTLQS